MAKQISKSRKSSTKTRKPFFSGRAQGRSPKLTVPKKKFSSLFKKTSRPSKVKLHKTFKRSYREDYIREIEVPGVMYHIFATFKVLFKNWKLFLPLLILSVLLAVVLIGVMNESTYRDFKSVIEQTAEQNNMGDIGNAAKAGLLLIATVTTGGLANSSNEVKVAFVTLIFLVIWLTTIFFLRHRLAGHKIKFREGLYNAMTPLISTLVVVIVALVECIPIFFLVVGYSAAVETEFLSTPFYALVFFVFAALMILISGYLLSSALMALVAVTAPGLYPMKAIHAASDLMAGRRVKFILRLIALVFALAVVWVIVMLPLIIFDLLMANFEWTANVPFVPICLLTMTCFTGIYISAYLYLYYRWVLNYDEK